MERLFVKGVPMTSPEDSLWTKSAPVLLALLGIQVLHAGKEIFIPIAMALLLHFILMPVMRFLRRMKIPDFAAAGIILAVILALITFGFAQLSDPAEEWGRKLPGLLKHTERKIRNVRSPVEEISKTAERISEMTEAPGEKNQQVVVKEESLFDAVVSGGADLLIFFGTTLLLLFFMLAYHELTVNNLLKAFSPENGESDRSLVRAVEQNVSSYLFTVTVIFVGVGALEGVAMWLVGMPNPALWGVMSTALCFIPYVGEIAGTAVVAFVAVLSFDEVHRMVLPPLVYYVVGSIEGTFVTPVVLGKRFTLNPLVIFMWLILWGYLWGVVGAFLAVPLLAVVKIACDHHPPLRKIGQIISG
jgi:predicted PurR-regulated permease PerM